MPGAIIPQYQRLGSSVPVSVIRRSLRPREKCLILLVFATLGIVVFWAFFYLPEYGKVSYQVQKAGADLLLPPSESKHGEAEDPHKRDDIEKLKIRIENDSEKVLDKPEVKRDSTERSFNHPEVIQASDPSKDLGENLIPRSRSPMLNGGEDRDDKSRERRNVVKKMMQHAWENYELYAWGKNELRPVTKRGHSASIFGSASLGASIIDGMDTLYIMGMDAEFQKGRDWIAHNLNLDNVSADLSVFETNIRFVGGLLTLFSFTGDSMYKDKAVHIADKLLPAFNTQTGIPLAIVNSRTGTSKNYGWASGGSSILSEFGTLHMEFTYLSDITGDPKYREKVDRIRDVIKKMDKPKGLYPNYIHPRSGKWGQAHMSLGALGDSFYEYLLKAWLQSNKQDVEARILYDDAMQAITEHMVRTSQGGLIYVSDMKFDRLEHKMDHLACFAGGLYGLGAKTQHNDQFSRHMEIAEGITNTCHESYSRSNTKLGPESFRFTDAIEAKALKSTEKYYILRPETVESYMIMWRLTKEQKYREWGWEVVQALERHCKVEGGYTGIKNVYSDDPQKDDVQQSFFLAETLKYLYLLFSDDNLISLDEWVFNTEAHPLPIKDVNPYYRAA
ncbi:Hypothetical predicted protein [Cloeon dipterum]|uniref:alpha-1,2-Mannosidase n=1 Tax=Cloeon dipterum TaxID=197152 RepID=A0A8S1D5D0_9INSE|nr:Hypothetical predicted protein [Cloeon dipterum]